MPRPTRPIRNALFVCALVPTAIALSACGGSDGLSADAVASVDGQDVTKTSFQHVQNLQLVAASQQIKGGKLLKEANPKLVSFKAPYTECVAAVKKTLTKEQAKTVQAAQLTQYCQGIPAQAKEGAVSSLITAEVVEGEAKKSKVSATPAEVKKGTTDLLTQLGATTKDLPKLQKLTGVTTAELQAQAKSTVLLTKIQAKIQKDAGTVTDADVQAYYNKNKAQYAQPESRNLHVVLTKTEAEAGKAKKAIEGGDAFSSVAKKYSIDQVTKKAGGKLDNVAKGQQEAAFEKAAFAAKAGDLVGPIKTESGYYVIRVDKVTAAKQIPFSQVKTVLKQQVQQTKPQEALQKWSDGVVKEWKTKTDCREGYNTAVFCKNAPKAATTTAAAGAATGQ
jgi:foldase protein PrsA